MPKDTQVEALVKEASMAVLTLLLWAILLSGVARAEDASALRAIFAEPPREYSTGPLWTWNDLLTEEQVVTTLRELAAQKVRQVWVHPQPGLMTPYLSADWFRLWKAALGEAKRLDMNIWMYDENSYPSGFAGGYVPEAMPESRGRGLHFREEKRPGKPGEDVLAVFRLDQHGASSVTAEARSGKPLPEGKYLSAVVVRAKDSPWFAGRCYVDLLYPGVTEKFLEITLEPYRRQFGAEFGKHIPGVFTDEPSILPAGGLPWTDDLPQCFQKRWGYSLLDHLPGLIRPVGDWHRIRHNYFQVLLELFVERWGKPYYEYCRRNGLELTGHYWDHAWPRCIGVPDNMAMAGWQQRPGIDILFNKYDDHDPHAQFGNVRIVKEIGSVANQLGRRRTLSETYAGSGHEIRFEEMKRQGDWQYALGLNTLNECLSHVTIRGVRKANYPRSLSYHNPWWEAYHVLEMYFTRLSAALSSGRQINPVLVLEPTTTAWMYQNDKHLQQIGEQFQSLLLGLERPQVEYDLGSEDIVARHGSTDGPWLVVGQRRYRAIVLPPLTENLNARTMDLLETCLKAGAKVFCCGQPPERIDGQASGCGQNASKSAGWKQVGAAALPDALLAESTDGLAIRRDAGDRGLLFHHRREFRDGQLLFLVNTSTDCQSCGAITSSAKGIEEWCPATGRIRPYRFLATGRGVEARFQLSPCGSLLLFLSNEPRQPAAESSEQLAVLGPTAPPQVRRLEDNVLVIDYLDLGTRGETKRGIHCRHATRQLFVRNGFPDNPWSHSVQFADEYIRRKFPPESGFDATYRFTIAERVPDKLHFVLERPDLYQSIACNGTPVKPIAGAWWLDRSFARIDVRSAARIGENTLSIKASAFSVFHELEPVYVLGKFSLQPAERGFLIVPEKPVELSAAPWNAQGHPFYSGGVAYTEQFEVADAAGRYFVELPDWLGSVAKVIVNGKAAGWIAWRPWTTEVTEFVQPGRNTIELLVLGTLRNTLGPHHAGPPRGEVLPTMFNQAPASGPPPGRQYNTVGYGLFRPFVLKNVK